MACARVITLGMRTGATLGMHLDIWRLYRAYRVCGQLCGHLRNWVYACACVTFLQDAGANVH